MPLFILFVIIPVIEITVLIKVGGFLGLFPTIGLILLTAMIGVTLLRVQGLSTLMRASESMQRGGLPAKEMAEGFLLALAGALLLTPGFVTDTFGFLLLTPGIRSQLATKILRLALQKGTI
ncbi:MAG TPA: exlusion protein FxsA, partial [Oceanospirillales bacterium]|nr:exlusion protein FxsA [Oceanospirillales bacterium]